MDFGAFILGILFGWLIEWLYVSFFSSQGSNMADCSAFERELKTRNEEIKSLKSQLGIEQGGASLLSKKITTPASVSSKPKPAKSKSAPATKSTSTDKATAKASSAKKTVGQKTAKKSSIKSSKSVASATKAKSTQPKKTGSAKASTSTKKNATLKKTATTKKAATKKTKATSASGTKKTIKKAVSPKPKSKVAKTAKKPTTKKKPAAKKISLKKDIKLNNPTGDDLTKLSGIGPSMAATLAELGITSYKKLAAMDDDILRDMLEASGARLNNNKEAMDSWNEQATLADKGDFVGLKKLQDDLKS